MVLGEDESNLNRKEKYSLSWLFKIMGESSRPINFNYDVNLAPHAPYSLHRKLLQTLQQHLLQKEKNHPQGVPTMHADYSITSCEKASIHVDLETSI